MTPHQGNGPHLFDGLEHMGVRVDFGARLASYQGRELPLTRAEFRLLTLLLREPGQVFTRAQLLEAVTGGGAVVLDRTVDVHVCALRRKLGTPRLIETVRGRGYRFRAAEAGPGADGKAP